MSWAVTCNTATQNPIVNSNRSAITFTGTLAPGALIILFCEWLGTGAIDPGLTVTDNVAGQPNTYTVVHQDVETVGGSTGSAVAYCRNPIGIVNGTTVGFNFSTIVTSAIISHVYPNYGGYVLDQFSGQITPDSNGTFSSGSITTAAAHALCVGFAGVHGQGGDVVPGGNVGATSGWNTRIGIGSASTAVSEDVGQDNAGAIAATFTSAVHDHATAYILSFKSVADPTIAFDDFNRADGSLGANWTNSPSLTGLQISGNQVVSSPSGNFKAAYYNAAPFTNDQHAQADVIGAGGNGAGVVVRHQAATSSFYAYLLNLGGDGFYIRYDNGTINVLTTDSAAGGGHASPTQVALRVVGSTLIASVGGLDRPPVTDTTYISGRPGVLCYNNAVDNFSAGPVVSTTGTLAATEGADSLAAGGNTASVGALATTEGADSFHGMGDLAGGPIVAMLHATEAPDQAAFVGDVISAGDVQSFSLIIRNVFFDALKADPFFAGYTCRKTPMNVVQIEHLPYLGVYLVDEAMLPDGDANAGPPHFIHTLRVAFSVMIANNDMDAAEAMVDAAWWRIMNRLLTDAHIMNVYYSTNPDNTLIEAVTRGTRRHVFGATALNQQTPIAELRYEMSCTFRSYWPPVITDELLEIDVSTGVKPGDTADEMARRLQVTRKYTFAPF